MHKMLHKCEKKLVFVGFQPSSAIVRQKMLKSAILSLCIPKYFMQWVNAPFSSIHFQ